MTNLQSNPQLELAYDYVSQTDKNIFLTGKAGTGKTTFLNRIKNDGIKSMAIVAPTGVAAINAGGMTIHSLFQLPFGPFIPGTTVDASRQRKFTRDKIRLIRRIDLLVIDEISMVRADVLDGIDDVLRRYKDRFKPFGGIQLLMIGDLHQLPPVVKDTEWDMLREHYETPYFFSSHALRQTQPVTIELKHIFRQSDIHFIGLLNKVRDNRIDAEVLDMLNSRYQPDFEPTESEPYITLSSHNASANAINQEKLAELPGRPERFKAVINGDFPEHAYPADVDLELKVGAQVMFIKNDLAPEKRFYNGKIGQVVGIGTERIRVRCPQDADEIVVTVSEWSNLKYTLNEATNEVVEEVMGTFHQFPLKLAWAITIHKSQGLTFERAIIDAQAAFAHGQVYVALSRCKSFEGIVLRTKIAYNSIKTDATVRNFSEEAEQNSPDEQQLIQAKIAFQQNHIRDLFGFRALKRYVELMNRIWLENESSLLAGGYQAFKQWGLDVEAQLLSVADKFAGQLQRYFMDASGEMPAQNEALQERIKKGSVWFSTRLQELIPAFQQIAIVTDNKTVRKAAQEGMERIEKELVVKLACFKATEPGFDINTYLKAKVHADLNFQSPIVSDQAARFASSGGRKTTHPELYARLKKWRDDEAANRNVEIFMITSTRTLMDIVEQLPRNMKDLKKIKGLGAAKGKRYGEDILRMINQYCLEQGLSMTNQLSFSEPELPEPPKKAIKPDTKKVSLELFQSGKSVTEIAAERGFTVATIEGHLAHFVALGQLPIYELMDPDKLDHLETFLRQNPKLTKSEIKTQVGDDFSYQDIQLALSHLDWVSKSSPD